MNDLRKGNVIKYDNSVCNIHGRDLYHFVGNSTLIKINITCNDRMMSNIEKVMVRKTKGPIFC